MQMKVKFCVEKRSVSACFGDFYSFQYKAVGLQNSLCCNELDSFSITECIFIRVNNRSFWVDCDE